MIRTLENLKKEDLYSIALFTLYKLTDTKEYSIIGELPYVVNRKDLINLCTYFGGRTIRVPKLTELYSVFNMLSLYHYHMIENMPYDTAAKMVGIKSANNVKFQKAYREICEILSSFNFKRRE